MQGRIFFNDNPWPEGHALKTLDFSCHLLPDRIDLLLHLGSEDYSETREIKTEDDEDNFLPEFEDIPEWQHPDSWYNYHACTLSNTYWGINKRTPINDPNTLFSMQAIANKTFSFNPVKTDENGIGDPAHEWDSDDQAFHIYLRSHDAVANHAITFTPQENSLLSLDWTGLVANAYIGDYHFKHKFRCEAKDVPFLGYQCSLMKGEVRREAETVPPVSVRETYHRNSASQLIDNADALNFYPRTNPYGTDWLSELPQRPSAWPVKESD